MPSCALDIAFPQPLPAETLHQSSANPRRSVSPRPLQGFPQGISGASFRESGQCRPPAPAPTLRPTATACIVSHPQSLQLAAPGRDSFGNSLLETVDCFSGNHPLPNLRNV